MKSIKLVLLVALVVAGTAIVIQNQEVWRVHFLWLTSDVPAIVLLLSTLAAGFIMGVVVTLLIKRSSTSKHLRGEK